MVLFLTTLLSLSLMGGLLTLLLYFLRRVAGVRIPSTFYYIALILVTLRFLIPVSGLIPALPVNLAVPAQKPLFPTVKIEYVTDDFSVGGEQTFFGGEEAEFYAGVTPPLVPMDHRESPFSHLRSVITSFPLTSIWAAGALVFFGWHLFGYLRFLRKLWPTRRNPSKEEWEIYRFQMLHYHFRRTIGFYRSDAVQTPMFLGIFLPMIVIPQREYTSEELEHILHHELSHCRRGDVMVKWLALLVSSVHWFNPITRLLRSELEQTCELSCDEWLLREMNADQKRSYGNLLLDMAADRNNLPRTVVATSFCHEKQKLKDRLKQIMSFQNLTRIGLALTAVALVAVLGVCCSLFPSGLFRGSSSGTDGDLSWRIDLDGTLTVSGSGEIDYAAPSDTPWYLATESIRKIVIKDGITAVRGYGFFDYNNVRVIGIPASVSYISEGAFGGCNRLTEIVVNLSNPYYCSWDGVLYDINETTLIQWPAGKWALDRRIVIPNTVSSVGTAAFYQCYDIDAFYACDQLTSIGYAAFYDCQNLSDIWLGNVSQIAPMAFCGSGLTEISIPGSTEFVGDTAFGFCKDLDQVYVEDGAAGVDKDAFKYSYPLVIHGSVGSYAQEYAAEQGYPFIDAKSSMSQFRDNESLRR